jgi:hypothetical protein
MVMMILLAVGVSNSFAQSRPAEPDKEAAIRNVLAGLLAPTGVQLGKALPQSEAQTHRQIQVRWEDSVALKSPGANKLAQLPGAGVITLVNSKNRDGVLPRERSLELSPNQILVVAIDENRGLQWWKLLLDPRIVRSETTAATGEIRGEDLYRPKVDFTIEYPDNPAIRELRFYHPAWTGKDFRLELLSSLSIR